jgi:hypothetical protein
LQTTLQRCPRNSEEQLGQIEAASFFEFAGTRFAGKTVAVSEVFGAVAELCDLTVKFRVEVEVERMHRVVAQIPSQENSC